MSVASPAPRVSLRSLVGGLLRFAAPSTGDPGSRRGPLGYARDLAPARCRFRSTRFLPRSTGRLVDPPASPRIPDNRHPHSRLHDRGTRRRGGRVFGNVPVLADAGDDDPQRGAIGAAAAEGAHQNSYSFHRRVTRTTI